MSNVFLRYALDLWTQQWRKRNARGEVYIVRYADDGIAVAQQHDDERRIWRQERGALYRGRFNGLLKPVIHSWSRGGRQSRGIRALTTTPVLPSLFPRSTARTRTHVLPPRFLPRWKHP
jgi:hypothetical protein